MLWEYFVFNEPKRTDPNHIAMEFKLETLQMSWAQTLCICVNAETSNEPFDSENAAEMFAL